MSKVIYDKCPKCDGEKDNRAKQCKRCFKESIQLDISSGFLLCPKCNETKSIDAFRYKIKNNKKAKCNVCRKCERAASKDNARQRRLMFLNGYPLLPNESWKDIPLRIKVKDVNCVRKNQIKRLLRECEIKNEDKVEKVLDMYFATLSCQICGSEVKNLKKVLQVDHCHDTNSIRGFLCNRCNTALGFFNSSQDILSNAIDYLNRPPIVESDIKKESGSDSSVKEN